MADAKPEETTPAAEPEAEPEVEAEAAAAAPARAVSFPKPEEDDQKKAIEGIQAEIETLKRHMVSARRMRSSRAAIKVTSRVAHNTVLTWYALHSPAERKTEL